MALLRRRKYVNIQKRRIMTISLVAIIALFTAQTSAWSYAVLGDRWAGTPTAGCCASLNVQYASTFSPGDQTAFDNARAAWNGSSANVILSYGSSNLTVGDTVNSSVGWDGLTSYNASSCGPPYVSWCFNYAHVLLNYYFTANYQAAATQGVAAHELGHALGLDHAPNCVLMNPLTSSRIVCGISGPVLDDINGVNSLY